MSGFQRIHTTKWLFHLGFFLLFVYVWYQGVKGIDFGLHWDELKLLRSAENSVQTKNFLPQWYHYPSTSYYITLIGSVPYYIYRNFFPAKTQDPSQKTSGAFISRRWCRILFLTITLLSSLWIYLWIGQWQKNNLEALLGAGLFLSSWELHYHARWIAPDGILMHFGILSVYLMFLAFKRTTNPLFWVRFSAVTSGFACSSKYPGGILLLPLFYTVFQIQQTSPSPRKIKEYLVVVFLFSLSFLVLTPGALFQTSTFIEDVRFEMQHYQQGHLENTVSAGPEHFFLMVQYLFFVVFSIHPVLATFFSFFILVGIYSVLHQEKRIGFLLLIVPISYIFYFSGQRVLIVRNLLLVFPFLSILMARGIFFTLKWIQPFPIAKKSFISVLVLLLALNFFWLYYAAESIAQKANIFHQEKIKKYLKQYPKSRYYLIESNLYDKNEPELVQMRNVTSQFETADFVIFPSDLYFQRKHWIGNQWGVFRTVSGIYDVNINYYPSWGGEKRILVVTKSTAESLKIGPSAEKH